MCGDNRVGKYSAVLYMSAGQRNNGENWLPGLHLGRRCPGPEVRNGEPLSWIAVSTIKAIWRLLKGEIVHDNSIKLYVLTHDTRMK